MVDFLQQLNRGGFVSVAVGPSDTIYCDGFATAARSFSDDSVIYNDDFWP